MSLLNKASLIQIPSGYKDGTLYSAKPTNGDGDFTFSRGSNLAATRVNSDGVIEKGRENLLLQSNQFDTTWVTNNASVTSGQSGYDGTNDAWKVEVTSSSYYLVQNLITSDVQTFSVYAKAGTLNWLILGMNGGAFTQASFDLQNGVLGSTSNAISSSIKQVGETGWYRCSVVVYKTTADRIIYPAIDDSDFSASSGYIYIQDAQAQQGLVSTDVITTTTTTAQAGILEDMPRLDYSGGATCPSLLLEPQRTNIFPQSEYLGSGGWVISNGTLTTNYAISPEGVQNAARINFTSGGYIVRTTSFTAGQDYTFSFYAKVESGTFDFTYGNINYSSISGTATTEWQRFEVTQTVPVATRYPKITATDTGDLLIYGMQCELGRYSTSLIPTYGASVTRGADYSLLSSASSIIGQSEGTAFVEFEIDRTISGTTRVITISDGGANERIGISLSTSVIYAFIVDGGVTQAEMTKSTSPSGIYKAAIAYKLNDVVFYLNGEQVGTDTSATMPTTNEIELGNQFGSNELGGSIKQAVLFKTRLSNDELATLTT